MVKPAPQRAAAVDSATPRRRPLPPGYPSKRELRKVYSQVAKFLADRDKTLLDPHRPRVHRLNFFDADLTLLNTVVALPLLSADLQPVIDPDSHRPVVLGTGPQRNQNLELAAWRTQLEQRHPALVLDWASLTFDRGPLADPKVIAATEPIAQSLQVLREGLSDPHARTTVLTFRPGAQTAEALEQYLADRGAPGVTVLNVGRQGHTAQLGLEGLSLEVERRKAVVQAAMIAAYDAQGDDVRKVSYIDDNPRFLQASMELLPAVHPDKDFEFWGVLHRGGEVFKHYLVGRYDAATGRMTDQGANVLDAEGLKRRLEFYASKQKAF